MPNLVTRWPAIVLALITLSATTQRAARAGEPPNVALRRPVAVARLGPWMLTANRDSGTISVVDPQQRRVVDELSVGGRPVALLSLDDGQRAVGADFERHELIWLSCSDNRVVIGARWPVARYPVALGSSPSGQQLAVSSLWSWTVTLWRRDQEGERQGEFSEQSARPVELPFAPRHLWFSPDEQHVIVADAFGGRLAIIACASARLVALREIDGHNIGGFATSHDGRHLLVAHQNLQSDKPSTDDNVFWGTVVNNGLESWPIDSLVRAPAAPRDASAADAPSALTAERLERGDFLPLGEPGHGTGDPQAPWIGPLGRTLVCLSGTHEVAVRANARQPMRRIAVGRRPVALAVDRRGELAVVANQFDDSLTLIELSTLAVADTISLGAMRPWTAAEQGEQLFYDARLSLDGWFSCHSCHVDGHTNHRLNDNLGDDSFGAPKRVLSLLGVAHTGPWQWNGSQATLAGQIRKSMEMTMRGGEVPANDPRVAALEAYLQTLAPPPSLASARARPGDTAAAERGRALFQRQACIECHQPPTYTSRSAWDVGLADERGARNFNPPSLRGVSQRGPYFHDGRAASLTDVFRRFRHGSVDWSDDKLRDLLEFLASL